MVATAASRARRGRGRRLEDADSGLRQRARGADDLFPRRGNVFDAQFHFDEFEPVKVPRSRPVAAAFH